MRVEPELLTHNKFKRLKRIVGDLAMEYIITLWAHCQSNQRGGFWPGADAEYVEMLCNWDGDPGVLFKALLECGKPKEGFIESATGGLVIHDWDRMNARFVANWHNGPRGGRPKTLGGNPTETQSENGLSLGFDGGSKGGSKPGNSETQREPNGNPVVNPMETQSGNGLTIRTKLNCTKLNLTEQGSETQWKPNGNPIREWVNPI